MKGASPAKVLVVDDQPANRRLLADLVTREGHVAVVASGGAEALEVVAREPVDLVLLDMMMPQVDGLAVLAELRARSLLPALPVVVITARDDRETRIEALEAGAIDFITKPIDRLEVASKMHTLVELRRLRQRALEEVADHLSASEHRYRVFFEQSPVAKFLWDLDFRVKDLNAAAERLFGYPRAEAIGQLGSFIVPPSTQPHVDTVWGELLGGAIRMSTNENITKDGQLLVCEWYNAPLVAVDGTTVGVSSVALDVTERARLQEALLQSQKMDAIGKLAGGIAHDFNNILATILSYASFVSDALPEGDERSEDIHEVLKAAERGAGLTRQLLSFSRQQPATEKAIDLNERLVELDRLLARTVGEHIEFVVRLCEQPAIVMMDAIKFDQVVLNLVVNARDAMVAGGELSLSLEIVSGAPPAPTAERVRLSVTDSGVGMDEATQRRVFEPFFTTKGPGKGTGFGLATSFANVAEAGGTIWVESALGQGSSFMVELPRAIRAAKAKSIEVLTSPAGGGQTILVVEDEPAILRATARVLERAGYVVHKASDGTEALRRLDELAGLVDLVLSDVVMPGCSGYDVADHAARVAPGATVLLTSGYLDDVARSRARTDLPILWKPVPQSELLQAIAEALRRAEP